MIDPNIYAVLNPEQIENLCRLFKIKKEELIPSFSGWRKRVLLTNKLVFLFARAPDIQNMLERELAIYKEFSKLKLKHLPRLIRRVDSKDIFYFPFGAVSRLSGIPLADIIDELSPEQLKHVLIDLAEIVADYHNIPVPRLPKNIVTNNNVEKIFHPDIFFEALMDNSKIDQAANTLLSSISKHTNINLSYDEKEELLQSLHRIAKLKKTLVHRDLHEDQILVENRNARAITGILDWETVSVNNPIYDFNFGEWGPQIWKRLNNFKQLRNGMWRMYLRQRKINDSKKDDLHIFYTLVEISWILKRKEKLLVSITQKPFKVSLENHMQELKVTLQENIYS